MSKKISPAPEMGSMGFLGWADLQGTMPANRHNEEKKKFPSLSSGRSVDTPVLLSTESVRVVLLP